MKNPKEPVRRSAVEVKPGTVTHGRWCTPEYFAWRNMLQRCYNKKAKYFHVYGARGITVCERWKESFQNFFDDMGVRPPGLTLERINNEKGYSPKNCKWASVKEQSRNRQTNRFITANGETRIVAEWAEIVGLKSSVIRGRIEDGWSAECAIFTPVAFRSSRTCKKNNGSP